MRTKEKKIKEGLTMEERKILGPEGQSSRKLFSTEEHGNQKRKQPRAEGEVTLEEMIRQDK